MTVQAQTTYNSFADIVTAFTIDSSSVTIFTDTLSNGDKKPYVLIDPFPMSIGVSATKIEGTHFDYQMILNPTPFYFTLYSTGALPVTSNINFKDSVLMYALSDQSNKFALWIVSKFIGAHINQ